MDVPCTRLAASCSQRKTCTCEPRETRSEAERSSRLWTAAGHINRRVENVRLEGNDGELQAERELIDGCTLKALIDAFIPVSLPRAATYAYKKESMCQIGFPKGR
jgi:hypothetical protein